MPTANHYRFDSRLDRGPKITGDKVQKYPTEVALLPVAPPGFFEILVRFGLRHVLVGHVEILDHLGEGGGEGRWHTDWRGR